MIRESAYIELMKNCSKWNSRIESERKCRYPVLDAQTGIAQRPSHSFHLSEAQRNAPVRPNQICTYPAKQWHKRPDAPSADATEMKFFYHCNPVLVDAINNVGMPGGANSQDFRILAPETSVAVGQNEEMLYVERRENKSLMVDNTLQPSIRFIHIKDGGNSVYDDDPDAPSPEEQTYGSEDEWSGGDARKKKRKKPSKAPSAKKTPSSSLSAMNSAIEPPKPFICCYCGAKYKSRPGLNYHKAHVHSDFHELHKNNPHSTIPGAGAAASSHTVTTTPIPHSNNTTSAMSNSTASTEYASSCGSGGGVAVEVSTFCDFCLGDRHENKRTNAPEDLVSCHDCGRSGHPSCLNFTSNMIISTKKYGWQCIECKSCVICGTSENDHALLFCDNCDRGFHLYCLNPPLSAPPDGEWSCHLCQVEFGATANQSSASRR